MIRQDRIGLAVIIKNEIDLVKKFIEDNKLVFLFSEIKFLDSFSTDGTWEALQSYKKDGIELFQREIGLDFSAQRNYLSKLMKSEYICRLDVDEFMNTKLIEFISVRNFDKEFYNILRKEYVDGNYLKDTPTPFIYKNIPEIYWQNRIHEVVFGYKSKALIPCECFLRHDKTAQRCDKQNKFYYNGWEEQRRFVDGK
jgi:hypothetical protein